MIIPGLGGACTYRVHRLPATLQTPRGWVTWADSARAARFDSSPRGYPLASDAGQAS